MIHILLLFDDHNHYQVIFFYIIKTCMIHNIRQASCGAYGRTGIGTSSSDQLPTTSHHHHVNVCIHDFDGAKEESNKVALKDKRCFKINTRLFQETKPCFKIH